MYSCPSILVIPSIRYPRNLVIMINRNYMNSFMRRQYLIVFIAWTASSALRRADYTRHTGARSLPAHQNSWSFHWYCPASQTQPIRKILDLYMWLVDIWIPTVYGCKNNKIHTNFACRQPAIQINKRPTCIIRTWSKLSFVILCRNIAVIYTELQVAIFTTIQDKNSENHIVITSN